jgi:hypothetical protein
MCVVVHELGVLVGPKSVINSLKKKYPSGLRQIEIPSLNFVFSGVLTIRTEIYRPTHSLTPWSTVLLEKLTGPQLVKEFPHLWNLKVHYSIHKCQINPVHTPTFHFLNIHLKYYTPIYFWVSQIVSIPPQVSPPKPRIRLSFPPYALYAPPISFFLILSPEQWVMSTYH